MKLGWRIYSLLSEDEHNRMFTSFLITILIPAFHLGFLYRFWITDPREVDEELCTCDCWDAYFKGGSYEHGPARYKNVYFNSNVESFAIWLGSMSFFFFIYECIKHTLKLYRRQQLRKSMLLLFINSFYSNYYGWWMYFNAVNDRFYNQFIHQTIFTSTELVLTCIAVKNMNSVNALNPKHIFYMLVIGCCHVGVALKDQFLINVILGEGLGYQISRDLGFMSADIVTVAVTSYLLRKNAGFENVLKTLSTNEISFVTAVCIFLCTAVSVL